MLSFNMSQVQFDKLKSAIVAKGIKIQGDTNGTINYEGASITFFYKEPNLDLNVVHAPMHMTAVAENKLKEFVTPYTEV